MIDDCALNDTDLAVLLGAVGFQRRIKNLTLCNCTIGPKSIVALADIIMAKRKQKAMLQRSNTQMSSTLGEEVKGL